jgi:3-oxo-5alpha-steroid 4-dehydrogenase
VSCRPSDTRDAADVPHWHEEAEVVVVGLGAAGASAAIEAARAEADVLVLECASGGGGTSATSHGQLYLGGGTPIQKACGFDDSPEEMFKYLVASCGPGPDEEKIRLFCEHSVEHFEWLVDQGVPFKASFFAEGTDPMTDDCLSYTGNELAYPWCDIARPAPRGHTVKQQGASGGVLMQRLLGAVERADVRVLPDTRCETLVVDGEHAVVGAVARTGGEERCVRARRGVVLTAGGFIQNPEMVARYAPLLQECTPVGCETDDGSGIRMGMGAGADAIRMEAGLVVLPFVSPVGLRRGVLVNRQGLRFLNEDVYQARAGEIAVYGQGGDVFLIVDDAIFERTDLPSVVVAVGEDVAELEAELGIPDGSLQATIRRYNEDAARGEDPLFHKAAEYLTPLVHPPFAALGYGETERCTTFTLGGLRTRPSGEVLTSDGRDVPGLYAAGATASGLAARGYNSGISLSDATFFGRQAGAQAARRASS